MEVINDARNSLLTFFFPSRKPERNEEDWRLVKVYNSTALATGKLAGLPSSKPKKLKLSA